MSRSKLIRSAASACALVLVTLAAVWPAMALAADEGVPPDIGEAVARALSDQQDQLPAGLENLGLGNGGVDLSQFLSPGQTAPDPNDGGQQTTAPAATNPVPAAPKPAKSTPKRSKPTRKVADSGSTGARRHSASPAGAKTTQTRAQPEPTVAPATAVQPAREATSSRRPQSKPRTVSPSIVTRVINRIPAEYQVALFGLGLLSALFAFASLRERRRSKRVAQQAMIDSLTALPNRQAFERRLAKEWRRAERYERSVGVLMIDLDDFKQINDGQGHAAGDRVLGEAAVLISGRIRFADMAARWGGDEFMVLCPETDADGLKVLARSLEDRLRHAGIASSAGFAEREPGDIGPSDLLARADVSMYARKQRDPRPERRRVTLADPSSSFAPLGH